MIISMLVALGVNAVFAFLSSGSMELMWSFLNVVQIMNYISLINIKFPNTVTYLFSYLKIANTDIQYFEGWFQSVFNLNSNTFKDDSPVSKNFNDAGYPSMRIIMNLGSQLAIICAFVIILPILLVMKHSLKILCKR
jgi:hypothetical protein